MLSVNNITKKFPGVIALDKVCLELEAGQVTAIIGENGAGKSTMMKILSGVYTDYEGDILLRGKKVRFSGTADARNSGIAIIHQELNFIPYLSITENIFLGRELRNRLGFLDKKAMRQKTAELLGKLKLGADPSTPMYRLKVGEQQVVEIAKALLGSSEVIIMDEPTSAISESEVNVLFGIIEDLRREGKAVVYISHKLDELFKIADRYIVLRDGKSVGSGPMAGMDEDGLIRQMVGREITIHRKQTALPADTPMLEVSGLCLAHRLSSKADVLQDISFTLGKGEILGIFGLMGAGRTELLETLFGLHPGRWKGRVKIAGKATSMGAPWDAIRAGLALVPEDRKRDGIVGGMNVRNNMSLTTLEKMERFGLLDQQRETQLAGKYIGELAVKTSGQSQMVNKLSGGNQQKVVLAKWLATHPKVLMLDEPTRGIDIHAKNEIYKLIIELADQGLSILMVSSELPEIFAVSDRILVLSEGKLTATLSAREATESSVLKASIAKTTI